jgi:transglutaminase-like putative cysteine protease
MEDTLIPSRYCDCSHPDIKAVATDLKRGEENPLIVATRTFYFVRDKCLFGFDLFNRKASETLQRGYGACWNKSLLLIALLRCNQIPARLGSIALKRTFIKPAIGRWHWLANNPYNHCLVHAYLNDRWIILDVPLDKGTYDTFFRPAGVKWEIDWNGKDDVRLYTESVAGPTIVYFDIDNAIKKKVRNLELPILLASIGNRYVNRILWKRVGRDPSENVGSFAPGNITAPS